MLYLLVNLTFFLVNEDFLNTALEVSTIYNDGFAKERLNELKEFSDYYSTNRKADNYLLIILNILEKRDYYDTEAARSINSVLELFPNREEEKIITFAKKIQ